MKAEISSTEAERLVESCAADLAFEGLICTDADRAAMRRLATGETTLEEELDAVIAKYQ